MSNSTFESYRKMRTKWLIHAIGGLLLTGFGLSLLGEAIILKMQLTNFLKWGSLGTLALVVFNSGLCLVVRAGSIHQKIKDLENK